MNVLQPWDLLKFSKNINVVTILQFEIASCKVFKFTRFMRIEMHITNNNYMFIVLFGTTSLMGYL